MGDIWQQVTKFVLCQASRIQGRNEVRWHPGQEIC